MEWSQQNKSFAKFYEHQNIFANFMNYSILSNIKITIFGKVYKNSILIFECIYLTNIHDFNILLDY